MWADWVPWDPNGVHIIWEFENAGGEIIQLEDRIQLVSPSNMDSELEELIPQVARATPMRIIEL